MESSLLQKGASQVNKQTAALESLLGLMGQKEKGLNFEAGSYMATLEYTIRSISGLKELL